MLDQVITCVYQFLSVCNLCSFPVWLVLWILPALRTRAQYKQPSDGRERAAPVCRCTVSRPAREGAGSGVGGWEESILHTVDKRGSDAKLGFLGKPGFSTQLMMKEGGPRGLIPTCWMSRRGRGSGAPRPSSPVTGPAGPNTGPKHTFLLVAMEVEPCGNPKGLSLCEKASFMPEVFCMIQGTVECLGCKKPEVHSNTPVIPPGTGRLCCLPAFAIGGDPVLKTKACPGGASNRRAVLLQVRGLCTERATHWNSSVPVPHAP